MADSRLRKLEREARQGDPEAAARAARERTRVAQPRRDPWEASYAVNGALHETVELLERAIRTAQRLRSQNGRASWQDAWEATHALGLARQLDAALAAPSADPTETLTPSDRAVVGAIRRAVEDLSSVVGGVPYWTSVLEPHGVSATTVELEAAFERIARASAVKHRWLVTADLRFARLAQGSFSASRRSRGRRPSSTHRGDRG
jgi:hypothetical protein